MLLRSLPNALTFANLACGTLAILLVATGASDTVQVVPLVFFGLLLDGVDGALARWLKVESAFGRQLDSLADIVTFGLAPAVMVGAFSVESATSTQIQRTLYLASLGSWPLLTAFRLARFQVQQQETVEIISRRSHQGLPAPAAACTWLSVLLAVDDLQLSPHQQLAVLLSAGILLGLAMASRASFPTLAALASHSGLAIVVLGGCLLVCFFSSPGIAVALSMAIYVSCAVWWPLLGRFGDS